MAARPTNEAITMGNYADLPPEQRPGYFANGQGATSPGVAYAPQGNVQYSTQQFAYTNAPASQGAPARNPPAPGSGGAGYGYANPSNITYTAKPIVPTTQQPAVRHTTQPTNQSYPQQAHPQYTASPHTSHPPPPPPPQSSYPPPPIGTHSPYPQDNQRAPPPQPGYSTTKDGRKVVEMVPGGGGKLNAPPSPGMRPHSLSVSGRPDGLTHRMDRLSVSGNRPDLQTIVPGGMSGGMGGGLPPPSPLLEAYHGTYQSISPMPGAMMMDDDLDHLPSLDSLAPRGAGNGRRRAHSSSRRSPSPPYSSKPKDRLALEAYGGGGGGRGDREERDRYREKEKRRARIYDATDDALALVDAMAQKTPDADAIIDILPALSHDQMLELRNEYKRHCKVQGRGINIAKHIKLKTSGNFGKIAYVTALGKYEGEGYWANYWYQSNSARRELLIEALMGRQNYEIREIKDAFKDKRYSDSLTRCMDKELKADKFRKAVLMALEAERQEESDVWPPEYRNRDVETLYRAIKAREGGESAMLGVVIMRSDAHLREVLRTYEHTYRTSFARDALRKSNNLVGEVIAHILNGVINRPARDAMLLHHAITDLIEPASSADNGPRGSSSRISASSKHERQQRYELLISRLVRLHWDRMHLARVKSEYEEKYGTLVEEDLEEATKGDFREFCIALCQTGR
ncbi:Annexin [Phaeosphaeriaceae sp. SRC1lsM3a]|nr:Annexin [Stagonospora sp. SRC1lsM3a]